MSSSAAAQGVLLLFNAEATRQPPPPDAQPAGAAAWHRRRGPSVLCRDARTKSRGGRPFSQAKDIAIEADFEWPQGGRSIYFRDPSGNSIEFAEPRIWGL